MDRFEGVDFLEKKDKVIPYLKYGIILVVLIPIILIVRHYVVTYSDVEKELVSLAKKYIKENSLNISDEDYIPLGKLGELEGAELCSNASGVIVTRKGNKYEYQAYLKCLDYETDLLSNSEKYIILSGDEVTLLNKGEIYEEMGYYSDEVLDVETIGNVGNRPGIYTILYKVMVDGKEKQTLTRKVIITEYDKASTNSGVTSGDKPTLTLLGDTVMVLERGEKFSEPGYRAVDYHDGKISRKVTVKSSTDLKKITNKIGTYTITYSITNSKNQTVTKTRTLKVVEHKSDIIIDSSIKKDPTGYVISLKITGSGYSHTLLPDNTIVKDTTISYKLKKEKDKETYSFGVYDIQGNVTVREVEINDIDTDGPSGNCVASVSTYTTNIYITATDKSGISGYNFTIDGINIYSDFTDKSTYSVSKQVTSSIAQVRDTYGNISTFECKINKNGPRGTITSGIMDVPVLLQTEYPDKIKWGNGKTTSVKTHGCGPTSVAMIVGYLNSGVNYKNLPQEIFEWLNSLGYFHGSGFGKAALTKAAAKYGVTCEWQKLDENGIKSTLLSGNPIIAYMGKGTFTSGGHYIVLKGVTTDGKIAVNDPFSKSRSNKTWDASLIVKEKATSAAFAVCH